MHTWRLVLHSVLALTQFGLRDTLSVNKRNKHHHPSSHWRGREKSSYFVCRRTLAGLPEFLLVQQLCGMSWMNLKCKVTTGIFESELDMLKKCIWTHTPKSTLFTLPGLCASFISSLSSFNHISQSGALSTILPSLLALTRITHSLLLHTASIYYPPNRNINSYIHLITISYPSPVTNITIT